MHILTTAALSVLYVVVTAAALLLGMTLLLVCALVAGCAAVAGRFGRRARIDGWQRAR